MKKWISDNWPGIVFVAFVLIIVFAFIALAIENGNANTICRDAGYVRRTVVYGAGKVCIGYVEGNQMIVVDFEDVKAGKQ